MKVGQIFTLPPDILYKLGHIGKLKDPAETKMLAKYEVVEIEYERRLDKKNEDGELIELVKELKGKIIVTYGNKRRKV